MASFGVSLKRQRAASRHESRQGCTDREEEQKMHSDSSGVWKQKTQIYLKTMNGLLYASM